MEIRQATFISSYNSYLKCPKPDRPEFAFIGRSNVGKSSLVNMLTNNKNLAKTSAKPGKTQTINHFLINEAWYLVDLPGYGYAAVSKSLKKDWGKMIDDYLLNRENLNALFILLDMRLPPQPIDLHFIDWAGRHEIPICLVFTKSDKLSTTAIKRNLALYENTLLKSWAELPPIIISSAIKKAGKEEIIQFIENAMTN